MGGTAAPQEVAIFGARDLEDEHDVCVDAETGDPFCEVKTAATGDLDFGISPRATPLIHGDFVYLFGVFGDLLCVELITGEIQWQINVRKKFGFEGELPWGYCGSPLIVGDLLIANPGAPMASLVGLDRLTGKVLWTPGEAPGYGSLIVAKLGGNKSWDAMPVLF